MSGPRRVLDLLSFRTRELVLAIHDGASQNQSESMAWTSFPFSHSGMRLIRAIPGKVSVTKPGSFRTAASGLSLCPSAVSLQGWSLRVLCWLKLLHSKSIIWLWLQTVVPKWHLGKWNQPGDSFSMNFLVVLGFDLLFVNLHGFFS